MSNLTDTLLAQYKLYYSSWTKHLLSKLPFVSYDYKVIHRLQDDLSNQIYQIEIKNCEVNDKSYCTAFKVVKKINNISTIEYVKYYHKTHYLCDVWGWRKLGNYGYSETLCDDVTSHIYMPLEYALIQIEMDRL